MNKYAITVILVLILGGVFFFVATNSKPIVQKEYKIVAFGDSLTAGFGIDKADSYPSVLEQRLRVINPNISVLNMGVSGETTADGLKRVDDIIQQKPDIVLLGLGANDILQSFSPSLAKVNLSSIIEKLQAEGVQVVLLGMQTSLNSPGAYRKEFNAIYPDLAEKYDLVLVPFFLKGVLLNEKLNIDDRLHPNKEGYIKIVDENIMPVVKELFK